MMSFIWFVISKKRFVRLERFVFKEKNIQAYMDCHLQENIR